MQLNGFLPVFAVALAGGALIEIVKWYGLRESENWPHYVKRKSYWAITAAMILAGGLLATLYGTKNVQAILALNIGAAAPAIIRAFGKPPEIEPPPGGGRRAGGKTAPRRARSPSVRSFLAGV